MSERTVTLHGTLTGTIWQGVPAQMTVHVDLTDRARLFVNANGSGLIDAVIATVDEAGDFVSARLTADSYIEIEHVQPNARRFGAYWSDVTRRTIVDVTDLPSLADYVDADEWAEWPE